MSTTDPSRGFLFTCVASAVVCEALMIGAALVATFAASGSAASGGALRLAVAAGATAGFFALWLVAPIAHRRRWYLSLFRVVVLAALLAFLFFWAYVVVLNAMSV